MKALIEELRAQHLELAAGAAELRTHLAPGRIEADPAAAFGVFRACGRRLRTHLEQEDVRFYPPARAHPECGPIVATFERDLRRLRMAVEAYLLGWPDPESLARNPQGFRDYTEVILRVLERRIAAEERDLFPRLELEALAGERGPEIPVVEGAR